MARRRIPVRTTLAVVSGQARGRDRPAGQVGRLLTVAAVAILLAACGGRTVALSDLAVEMDRYDGEDVTTRGVVVELGGGDADYERYFVIQDRDQNRVRLLPDEEAEPYAGAPVEVAGTFEFDPDQGRLLHIDTIERVQADP